MRAPSRGLGAARRAKAGVQQLGRDGAGVQRVHRDAGAPQPLGELVGKEQVAELREPVGRVAVVAFLALEVVRSTGARWCTAELTTTIRAGAAGSSRSSIRLVSRNGARWFDLERGLEAVFGEVAALLIDAGVVDQDVQAVGEAAHLVGQHPHLASDVKSASTTSTSSLPVDEQMSRRAASARPASRPCSNTRAPRRASSRAVSLPMPSVAPVTRTVRPRDRPGFVHHGPSCRRRRAPSGADVARRKRLEPSFPRWFRRQTSATASAADLVPRGPSTHPLPA